jgi:hypothetical protein
MKFMMRLPVIGIIVLLAGASLVQGQQHEAERSHRDAIPFGPEATLQVILTDGRLNLQGIDGGEVQIEMVKTVRAYRGAGADEAEALVEKIELVTEKSDERIRISTKLPRGCKRELDCRVDLTISVPEGATVSARADDGDIYVTNASGSFDLHTDDGDVHLTDVSGRIDIRADDGDVEAAIASNTMLTVRADDGDIRLVLAVDDGDEPAILVEQDDGKTRSDFRVFTSRESYAAAFKSGLLEGGGWPRAELRVEDGDIEIERREP